MDRQRFLTRTVIKPYVDNTTFILTMWDSQGLTNCVDKYHNACGYMLVEKGKGIIFKGNDFGCGQLTSIDSEDCVRSLLGFLSLKPGDTDQEYFNDYTEKQLDFAIEHGETLSLYTIDDNPDQFDLFEIL